MERLIGPKEVEFKNKHKHSNDFKIEVTPLNGFGAFTKIECEVCNEKEDITDPDLF